MLLSAMVVVHTMPWEEDRRSSGTLVIADVTLVNAMKQAPCVASIITRVTQNGCLPVPNLIITSAVQTR